MFPTRTLFVVYFCSFLSKCCNLRGHLQRCQMPDIENSRKGCRVGHGKTAEKQPEKHPKNTRKQSKQLFFVCFGCFFRLFFGCLTVTHSAPFSAVFRLFSMSGIWHLCRWPWRLQHLVQEDPPLECPEAMRKPERWC